VIEKEFAPWWCDTLPKLVSRGFGGVNENGKKETVFGLAEPPVFSLFFLARCREEHFTRFLQEKRQCRNLVLKRLTAMITWFVIHVKQHLGSKDSIIARSVVKKWKN
jgi:hypothetical protein